VASRVIAPYFGNSVYVWGSLIGVFLAALSAGYYLGGVIADRAPSGALFAGIVFLAGALVFPIPFFAPVVLDAIVLADYGPRGGPLVATISLFFLPSLVFKPNLKRLVRLVLSFWPRCLGLVLEW